MASDEEEDGEDPADRPDGHAGSQGHDELTGREGGAYEDRVGVIQTLA